MNFGWRAVFRSLAISTMDLSYSFVVKCIWNHLFQIIWKVRLLLKFQRVTQFCFPSCSSLSSTLASDVHLPVDYIHFIFFLYKRTHNANPSSFKLFAFVLWHTMYIRDMKKLKLCFEININCTLRNGSLTTYGYRLHFWARTQTHTHTQRITQQWKCTVMHT